MTLFTLVPLLLSLASAAPDSGPPTQERIRLPDVTAEDKTLSLAMYDVEDILDLISPPGITLDGHYEGEVAEKLREAERAKRTSAMSALQQAILQHILPAWDRNRNVVQPVGEKVLAVSAMSSQHRWIEAFLGNIRAEGVGQVMITTVLFEVPRGTLKSLGIEPPIARLENRKAFEAAREKIRQTPECQVISSPKVVLRPFRRAVFTISNEVSYIKEWEVKLIEPQKQLIADPVIDTVNEGYEMHPMTVPLPGGRYGMELRFERTSIARPIPTKKITLSTDPVQEVWISLPEVTRVSLETSLIFDDGSSAIFATPANDEIHDLVVILTLEEVAAGRPSPGKKEQGL